MPTMIWTHYLLYILTSGTLRKPHFLTPRSKQNASLFRVVPRIPPRSCKVAPMGPKNGESGVPREHQGCQKVPKWSQNGSKWEPKRCPNSRFRKKVPKVVWTHYLLYILTTGTLQKPYFFTPPSNKNAGLFRVVSRTPPRSCKMAPLGPKNGESGLPRDPQGCQRVSHCLPKCSKK